jgi:tetratricopeptide (TPR) repeat protein
MRNIVIETSCKNSMKTDFERNRITAARQSFRAALLLMVVFLLLPVQSLASTKVFEREYTYSASEADSKLTCRVIALEQVKRLLLEELGTYLHSISEVKDGILTKDEIVTLTAGVVRTEIISEHWDGNVYRLKARIKADPDYVIEAIDRLRKDSQKSKDLEESRAKTEQYLKEIEHLKIELVEAKGSDLGRKQHKYVSIVKRLSAEDWFERGIAFEESKRYEEAIKAYTKAIEMNPILTGAYNNRGNVWRDIGDFDRSYNDFNKMIELGSNSIFAYIGRGNALSDKGKYLQAVQDYNSCLLINPNFAEAYHNRGYAWMELKKYDKAISDFEKALQLKPQYASVYIHRAIIWAEIGDYDRAISDDTKAIQINPLSKIAYKNRGNSFVRKFVEGTKNRVYDKGLIDQAIADFKRALKIDPNYTDAYHDLQIAYKMLQFLNQ